MENNIIAVLPLGAHEYHGPHLPFETDSLIAEAFAGQIKQKLPADFPARFLPVEKIGYSREHMPVAGTQTLSYDEAIEKWLNIAAGQHKQGVRKFIMLNAHGGNSPLMTIIATELRARFDMLAVFTSLSRFGLPEGLLGPAEKALDIHGGFIETSIMLAIAPEKVNMREAQDFANAQQFYARKFTHLRAYGPHAFGWLMQDINPLGAAGAAARATPQAGRQILTHAAKEAAKLFADVEKFTLNALNAPASAPILAPGA